MTSFYQNLLEASYDTYKFQAKFNPLSTYPQLSFVINNKGLDYGAVFAFNLDETEALAKAMLAWVREQKEKEAA